MSDDDHADRKPNAKATPPVDAWATVRVDGEKITRFEVTADERVEIYLDADERTGGSDA
jgi:hypothetical protein